MDLFLHSVLMCADSLSPLLGKQDFLLQTTLQHVLLPVHLGSFSLSALKHAGVLFHML